MAQGVETVTRVGPGQSRLAGRGWGGDITSARSCHWGKVEREVNIRRKSKKKTIGYYRHFIILSNHEKSFSETVF